MRADLALYTDLLGKIKSRIRQSQTGAVRAANREMLAMYWDVAASLSKSKEPKDGVPAFFAALPLT